MRTIKNIYLPFLLNDVTTEGVTAFSNARANDIMKMKKFLGVEFQTKRRKDYI